MCFMTSVFGGEGENLTYEATYPQKINNRILQPMNLKENKHKTLKIQSLVTNLIPDLLSGKQEVKYLVGFFFFLLHHKKARLKG